MPTCPYLDYVSTKPNQPADQDSEDQTIWSYEGVNLCQKHKHFRVVSQDVPRRGWPLQVPCVSKLSKTQVGKSQNINLYTSDSPKAGPAVTLGSWWRPRLGARKSPVQSKLSKAQVGDQNIGLSTSDPSRPGSQVSSSWREPSFEVPALKLLLREDHLHAVTQVGRNRTSVSLHLKDFLHPKINLG